MSGRSIVVVHTLWERTVRVRFSAPRHCNEPAVQWTAVAPKGVQSEFDSRRPDKQTAYGRFLRGWRELERKGDSKTSRRIAFCSGLG